MLFYWLQFLHIGRLVTSMVLSNANVNRKFHRLESAVTLSDQEAAIGSGDALNGAGSVDNSALFNGSYHGVVAAQMHFSGYSHTSQ